MNTMRSAQWFLLVGGLLLSMGLSRPTLGRLPVTSAIIYLLVGLVDFVDAHLEM